MGELEGSWVGLGMRVDVSVATVALGIMIAFGKVVIEVVDSFESLGTMVWHTTHFRFSVRQSRV